MQLEPLIPSLMQEGRISVDFGTGHVFSITSNTPDKPLGAITAKGYLRIGLSVGGAQAHALAHRVVWCAANGPVPDGMQIDHVNGDKTDNRLINLECVSGPENMKRAARNGLTNGGWRDAPRDAATGRFMSKENDGRTWDEYPAAMNSDEEAEDG